MTETGAGEGSTRILPVVREELEFAWRIVLCAFYISWWRLKHYIWTDTKLEKRSAALAIFASFILFVEILLSAFHIEIWAWLGTSAKVLLVPTAGVFLLHKIGEFRSKRWQNSFARHAAPLFDAYFDLSSPTDTPDAERDKLDSFVQTLLNHLCQDVAAGQARPATASIMMRDHRAPPPLDEKLKIVWLFPLGTKYDPNIRFDPGVGAAGFCYQKARTVYVPSIRYMHGIVIGEFQGEVEYGLKRRLYVPIAKEYEVYESILCLPVTSKDGRTHGVLNVDSDSVDAFSLQDVDVLQAYARILGDAISLYF